LNAAKCWQTIMTAHTARTYACTTLPTPVGERKLVASNQGLAAVLWENDKPNRVRLPVLRRDAAHPVLIQAASELREYFEGRRTVFEVPLDPHGTSFQQSVWEQLRRIPFGETRTYGEIARALGKPSATRAVGAANGRNPLSIVAPCHRVIGHDGSLTGFAGGLETKEYLLRLEHRA
jgi:methylated-DNA-[protein]-cysteine S-methyltransferase